MRLKIGIIGLPNVGKSTLFNALLKKRVALSANYPFTTVEPNVGVVAVPDERLEKLAELVARSTSEESLRLRSGPPSEVSKKPPIVPAVVEFIDIAGLVQGASKGAGLGNQFLSHIREVDAIVHVLRNFEDENVVREGSVSPDEDKLIVETELALSDLQVIEKLISGQDKQVKIAKDPLDQTKLDILNKIKEKLEKGEIESFDYFDSAQYKFAQDLRDERLKDWFEHLPLLSIKPVLYVYNVSENVISEHLEGEKNARFAARRAATPSRWNGKNGIVICAKMEEELADYSEEERLEYLRTLGIKQTGLERLIVKAYNLLDLISFFTTTGKKEVRAWTLRRGETALMASGVIHTDFMKNFIRAQVIPYDKLIEAGSYAAAKQKGWIKTEGKDYIVQDGDVIEFLVSS